MIHTSLLVLISWWETGYPTRRVQRSGQRMCGIVGIVSSDPANQQIYDALLQLQHRGQDATGIATMDGSTLYSSKGRGGVREAFRTRDMRSLLGTVGLGHVRYTTSGDAASEREVQPFYVNAPYGITLVHNGNLTNVRELADELFHVDRRHVNSSSDTELLLNVLANELQRQIGGPELQPDQVFAAVRHTHRRLEGSYAVVAMIAGYGLLAFRDPCGIRPLAVGRRERGGEAEWMVCSESVAAEASGFDLVREVEPGEAVFISDDGELFAQQCAQDARLAPCALEYVYLARPDSVMNGISVYQARLRMGDRLAERVRSSGTFDVVMCVPDTARPIAMQVARRLGVEYREGFYKNSYVGRTFIMPGQTRRARSVRHKLNPISGEFTEKNVLLVEDSIIRGTTSAQAIELARGAGAKSVTFASAAPPVRYPNVYGINMPTPDELIANNRSNDEIAARLGADQIIYSEVDDLRAAITEGSPLEELEMNCFTGDHVTGTVGDEYLAWRRETQHS